MSIVVQSRFACLKAEDEEPAAKPQKTVQKDNKNKKDKEKDKKNSTNNNTSKQSTKKQKAVKLATARQWEEWKQKDETLVNGNFEQDLENALMLSKIHYEENKEKYRKTEEVKGKKVEKKKSSKKTISLDVFLAGEPAKESNDTSTNAEKEPKEDFFEKISEDSKQVLNNEKFKDLVRGRQNVVDEVISSAQYKEKLEIERQKNEALKQELEQCKSEITAVKERNKTLYTLLSTGEMKGKAEIINDLEKLTVIKDELTQEVARLHGLLEQERSKVAALTNERPTHKKSAKKHS